MNSGYNPAGNGLAERWVGIVKVRATTLLADVRLLPEYWSYVSGEVWGRVLGKNWSCVNGARRSEE